MNWTLGRAAALLIGERLRKYVALSGGANALLHYGQKVTKAIRVHLSFEEKVYRIEFAPTDDERLIITEESLYDHFGGSFKGVVGSMESRAPQALKEKPHYFFLDSFVPAIQSWKVYHFQDMSSSAPVKKTGDVHDNEFLLRPNPLSEDTIRLEWKEKGSDYRFGPHQISDGTLRFMALATLLLQPNLPSTVLIDEPELGLHPAALSVLGGLVRSAATRTQVILTTQSVTFLNEFEPEDVITVDREDGASVFRRHSTDDLAAWLEDYSLAEIWEKNIIGGRP